MRDALIDEQERVDPALEQLAAAEVLAVDTEFLWERTYLPTLALVQVAGRVGEDLVAFAFDPLAVELTGLYELLAQPQRLKVFHAGRIDLELLNARLPQPLTPVYDTQVAAALAGFGSQVGYANLVEVMLGETLGKAEQYADWTRRPLRPAQLDYALLDVLPLLEVHARLEARLVELSRRQWLDEELAALSDPETYVQPQPRERYLKVKGRRGLDRRSLGVLRELAAWREQEAERRDVRPSFVIKDQALLDIARRAPRNQRELEHVRGLHGRELQRSGRAIIKAIDRARKLPESELPERARRQGAKQRVGAVVDLLRAYLHQRSEELGVAVETITTTSELERLARDGERERYAADHPLLQGWRRALVGEDLLRILRGELRLAVDPEEQRLRLDGPGAAREGDAP
ncbi:MAG: ribonuclease D [Planctomycetota bacterium]